MDVHYHLSRWATLEAERSNHESDWEELATYILPGRVGARVRREPGDRSDQDNVFDQTAVRANIKLASSMHGALTGPSAKWFGLRFRNESIEKADAAREWAEDCEDSIFAALSESNFNSRINECYLDLGAFGLEVMWCGISDKDNRLVFDTFPIYECAVAEGEDGSVDTLYRGFDLTARQARDRWPDADLPTADKFIDEGKPDNKLAFVSCVEPNKDYDPEAKLDDTKRPYYSCVICIPDKTKVDETGYWSQPFIAPRWAKRTGDPYGWGPGHSAINDVKTINLAKSIELDAWEKSVDPPMKGMNGVIVGDVNLVAGGVTMMDDMRALEPLVNPTNWNAVMIKGQELQDSIKQSFYDRMLDFPGGPNVTATEIVRRTELMQRELAPVLGRLQTEMLSPLIERIFDVMNRAGLLPEPPEVVVAAGGENIDIEFVSPMARAQRAGDIEAIERWVGTLGNLAQINPRVLNRVDWDALPNVLAERMGTPSEVVASDEQVAEVEKQQAKAAAQQQQLEQGGDV